MKDGCEKLEYTTLLSINNKMLILINLGFYLLMRFFKKSYLIKIGIFTVGCFVVVFSFSLNCQSHHQIETKIFFVLFSIFFLLLFLMANEMKI
jgi:hypothetical protein